MRWWVTNDDDIDGPSQGRWVDIFIVLVWGTDCAHGSTNVVHRVRDIGVGVTGGLSLLLGPTSWIEDY